MVDLGPLRIRRYPECWVIYLVRPHFATGRIGAVCIPDPAIPLPRPPLRYVFENAFDTLEHLYADEVDSDLVDVCP